MSTTSSDMAFLLFLCINPELLPPTNLASSHFLNIATNSQSTNRETHNKHVTDYAIPATSNAHRLASKHRTTQAQTHNTKYNFTHSVGAWQLVRANHHKHKQTPSVGNTHDIPTHEVLKNLESIFSPHIATPFTCKACTYGYPQDSLTETSKPLAPQICLQPHSNTWSMQEVCTVAFHFSG